MTDIFREVDEDLRRERYEKLWRRHSKHLIAAAVAIVLGTGGYVAWKQYREAQRLDRGTQYASASDLIERGELGAAAGFAALAEGGDGYAALARLQQAAMKAEAGDVAAALDMYEALAADVGVDRAFRDLAVVLIALHTIDTADPAALSARLAPLTAEDHPWRHSALEFTGLLAKRAGDTAKAREAFAKLAADEHAPPALRQRAAELLNAL